MLESSKDKAFTEDEILKVLYPTHVGWPIDHTVFNVVIMILEISRKS